MATGIQAWSTTAADNDDADSGINWAEGQTPASINNSARAMMAALAAFYDTVGGGGTYGGSSSDYTITNPAAGAWTAYASGNLIALKANHTNDDTTVQLNVDALGNKRIKTCDGGDPAIGDIVSGGIYLLAYDGTNFQILNTIGGGSYQPLDATLTALAALSYTSGTLNVQLTAADTFALASDALNAKLAGTTAFTAQQTMTVTSAGAASTSLILRNASSSANTAATLQLNPSAAPTRYAEIAAINDSTNAIRVIIRPSNGGAMVDALTAAPSGALTDSEALPIRSAGKQAIPIPASAMVPNTTNGAAPVTSESSTNKVMTRTLDFDQTTQEGAQFLIPMPKSWNEGTVTFQPVWTATSGTGSVVWELRGVAFSDDDAIDAAFGTGQTSTDTLIATGDVHIGPESSAITIAGTPATGDLVVFQVRRNVSDGSDTLTADAKLIAIRLNITTDAKNDA